MGASIFGGVSLPESNSETSNQADMVHDDVSTALSGRGDLTEAPKISIHAYLGNNLGGSQENGTYLWYSGTDEDTSAIPRPQITRPMTIMAKPFFPPAEASKAVPIPLTKIPTTAA